MACWASFVPGWPKNAQCWASFVPGLARKVASGESYGPIGTRKAAFWQSLSQGRPARREAELELLVCLLSHHLPAAHQLRESRGSQPLPRAEGRHRHCGHGRREADEALRVGVPAALDRPCESPMESITRPPAWTRMGRLRREPRRWCRPTSTARSDPRACAQCA